MYLYLYYVKKMLYFQVFLGVTEYSGQNGNNIYTLILVYSMLGSIYHTKQIGNI